MLKRTLVVTVATLLGACAVAVPEDAEVLTGEALSAALADRKLTIAPPPDSGFSGDVLQVISLRANGSASMVALLDGEPTGLMDDNRQWTVRGQRLCIFDLPQPDPRDCIRVDWVGGGRFQLTEVNSDGTSVTGVGTLSAL